MTTIDNFTTIEVIKHFTGVPGNFVDDFFSLYEKNVSKDDYIVNLDTLSKWLNVTNFEIENTVRQRYVKNIDYIEINSPMLNTNNNGDNTYNNIMLTYNCMKRLCVSVISEQSENVRRYFMDIERILIYYNDPTLIE